MDSAAFDGVESTSVIGVGGGAGGQFGRRAASREVASAAAASPASPGSLELGEDLRSLGYLGFVDEEQGLVAGLEASDQRGRKSTWERATVAPNSARLAVGENDVLPLSGASTEVHVEGFRARVVTDLVFLNDRDRQLEGSFELRLPDGASPYYLAFGAETWESAEPPVDG